MRTKKNVGLRLQSPFSILMMIWAVPLLILQLVAGAQNPGGAPAPVPNQEKDFSLSLYFTGDMQGNLEPCG